MPGSTLITAAVLALAEGFIEVKPLGPVPVKGWRPRWRCMRWWTWGRCGRLQAAVPVA